MSLSALCKALWTTVHFCPILLEAQEQKIKLYPNSGEKEGGSKNITCFLVYKIGGTYFYFSLVHHTQITSAQFCRGTGAKQWIIFCCAVFIPILEKRGSKNITYIFWYKNLEGHILFQFSSLKQQSTWNIFYFGTVFSDFIETQTS